MLEKCVLTMLELNWNQRLGHKKRKLNICHHMLTSSTQLQNWSFHVVERTRTSSKCQKMKNARAKRAKILFFVVKYANLWGFCWSRRRGCSSSLMSLIARNINRTTALTARLFFFIRPIRFLVTFRCRSYGHTTGPGVDTCPFYFKTFFIAKEWDLGRTLRKMVPRLLPYKWDRGKGKCEKRSPLSLRRANA